MPFRFAPRHGARSPKCPFDRGRACVCGVALAHGFCLSPLSRLVCPALCRDSEDCPRLLPFAAFAARLVVSKVSESGSAASGNLLVFQDVFCGIFEAQTPPERVGSAWLRFMAPRVYISTVGKRPRCGQFLYEFVWWRRRPVVAVVLQSPH